MDTLGDLEKWLKRMAKRKKSEFPGGGSQDYALRYEAIAEYLRTQVHDDVVAGANIADGGHLTKHGASHIKTLLERASQLVQASTCKLTAYEVYMLLVAAQFHDVGNIYGRKNHTGRVAQIVRSLNQLAGDDTPEKRRISQIAEAHGAGADGDKDTISTLPVREDVLGKSVRLQLLAAILRFADELSDDSFRASRFMIKEGRVPRQSEIFHKFAESLDSVKIDHEGREVRLKFELDEQTTQGKFGKDEGEAYLLDEIFDRSVKMHLERIYCMRYMRDQIPLDAIDVQIVIFHSTEWQEIERLQYKLKESGYPHADLSCKALTGFTGEELRASISSKVGGAL